MKYEGKKKASNDVTVYSFILNKEEVNILLKMVDNAYNHTPAGIIGLTQYRDRLRAIHNVLGRVYVEEIKGSKLPTKRTANLHKKISLNVKK